ncbi:T9SS type A sorting domain-containing protein [Brumimicrobium oceani]|uniref:Secretion system C-terminal sorting domain-containing protein n=1 Tax=Brumimicrobium oceani TaxID=2100725 RepID=A0A2U2XAX9_9FLAO|nr:T9SS type A sorting domain-containing protein [Brumimicrobium oceani]PWH84955.1 hypothetical protein DIT68_11315 [Brumimicrobium oceani]
MKKKLFLLFFLMSGGLFGQQTSEFEFEIYFEDALGNRDSVTIGYDYLAHNGIDANFGENDLLNQSWNNGLQVRVGDKTYSGLPLSSEWIQPNSYLSKKQIINSYCDESDYSERVSIQFTSDNYPITINWNDKLFEENCHKYSILFGQDDHYHFDAAGLIMLRSINSLVIDSSLYFEGRKLASYEKDGKEIGVVQFVFHRYNTLDVSNYDLDEVRIYPNPLINNLVNVEFEGQYVLQDMTGKIIQLGKVSHNKIGFDGLEKGIYNLRLINEDIIHQFKIKKQ